MDLLRVDETCGRERTLALLGALAVSRMAESMFLVIGARALYTLNFQALVVFASLLIQILVASVLKWLFALPRPSTSCLEGPYGFPSTHVYCCAYLTVLYSFYTVRSALERGARRHRRDPREHPSARVSWQHALLALYQCTLLISGTVAVGCSRIVLGHTDSGRALSSGALGVTASSVQLLLAYCARALFEQSVSTPRMQRSYNASVEPRSSASLRAPKTHVE